MIQVGVLGSKGKARVSEIIKDFGDKAGVTTVILDDGNDFILEQAKEYKLEPDFVIIKIDNDYLSKMIENDDALFDVLIQTNFDDDLIGKDTMNMLVKRVKNKGYVIINADLIGDLELQCKDLYLITYGLNNKSTVTASSVDEVEFLEFSFCLQRSVTTISEEIIAPFEKPIIAKGEYGDIKYYLPALTCLMISGVKFYI